MALDDDIGILAGVGIFGEFTREQLRLLAFGTERLRLAAGKELYREGAAADCAFVVVSGRVALVRDVNGERVRLASMGPGALLGELALITQSRRLTSAVTETDCQLMRLNRNLFRRILEEYPEVAMLLHRRLTAEFADMTARIDGLSPKFS